MAKLTGTNPDQVPTNADLGTMAYQDKDNLQVGNVEAKGTINFTDKVGVDRLHISGGSGGAIINNNDNSGIKFQYAGTQLALIKSSGNVGIGDADPDSHYGGEYRLVVRDNQDAMSRMGLTNSNSASGAGVEYRWISGTGNSNMAHSLFDNNGTPFARLSMGSAVINYDIYIGGAQAFLIRGSNKEVVVPSGLLELDGNDIGGTQVTIADDAVASITPPRKGGFMTIILNGNSDFPQQGHQAMLRYDVGSSLAIDETAIGGGNIDTTTSDVSGTTGTDGNTTVAVQTGVIKIENRSGSSGTYQVTFL